MLTSLSDIGPKVSKVVAGVMNWGAGGAKLSTMDMANLIKQCVDIGVTCFDHADIYGGYTSETEFGKALNASGIPRDQIQVITKCGICYPGDQRPGFKLKYYDTSKSYILKAVDQSLKNLRTDRIDLLLIHRPSPLMDFKELSATFEELQKSGKVNYVGTSNFTSAQMGSLMSFHPVVTNQIQASIWHLEPFLNGDLDFCQQHRIKPMAWSPLGGGNAFKKSGQYDFVLKRDRIMDVSKTLGLSYEQISYAFLFNHPSGIVPVTGSSRFSRIKIAVDSLKIKLSKQEWFEIWTACTGKRVP